MLKIWKVSPYKYNNGRIARVTTPCSVCSRLFSTSTSCSTLPFLEKSHPPKFKRSQPAASQPTSEYTKFHQRIIHSTFPSDVELLLKLNSPSTATLSHRSNISSLLSRNLEKVAPNGALSIGNLSLGDYAKDIDNAPIEFIVQDGKQLSALPEQVQDSVVPFKLDETLNLPKLYPSPSSIEDSLYSERLVFSPQQPTPLFSLHPPNPFYPRLLELLRTFSVLQPDLPKLIAVVYLWSRSNEFVEFSPISLALMVIAFLQSDGRLYCLQSPSRTGFVKPYSLREPEGFPSDRTPEATPERPLYDVRFLVPTMPLSSLEVGQAFVDFLHFYGHWNASERFISVRNGGQMPRVPGKTRTSFLMDLTLKDSIDGSNWTPPLAWKDHPVIIQDPFIPTMNCVSHVSDDQWLRFVQTAREHSIELGPEQRYPLTSACGPFKLDAERVSLHPHIRSHIQKYFTAARPSNRVLEARKNITDRIQRQIGLEFGRGYRLEVFGSTRYGVDTNTSDLDLVIKDPTFVRGHPPEVAEDALPDIYDMRKLGAVLRAAGFTITRSIPNANVPIVKAVDRASKIAFDINTNDLLGFYNTSMFQRYCSISPILAPLLVFIKAWAKSHYLNAPADNPPSMSSYCYALMTVAFLQSRGVLPNLQEDLGEAKDSDGYWLRQKGLRIWCDPRFHYRPATGWKPQPMSMEDALLGWFRYWATEHDYERTISSIKYRGLIQRVQPYHIPVGASKNQRKKNHRVSQFYTPVEKAMMAKTKDLTNQAEPEQAQSEAVTHIPGGFDVAPSTNREEDEPDIWASEFLVVEDPFVFLKNVAAKVPRTTVLRFKAECKRSMFILEAGQPVSNTLGRPEDQLTFAAKANGGIQEDQIR